MNRKKLGSNLKKARIKEDLTQAEVANKAGLHVNYYARVERGEEKAKLETLETIAKVLKVKLADLLS